jgi:ribosome-associated toxin RatA of RatAB toxin-antitoxin module
MYPDDQLLSGPARPPWALRAGLLGVVALAGLGLCADSPARAADAARPHRHQGVLQPVSLRSMRFALSDEERARLAAGEPVRRQLQSAGGGRGVVVQDIRADVDTVWRLVTDMERYPGRVPNIEQAEVYDRAGGHLRTRFVLGSFGVSAEYYVDHALDRERGAMCWTLDYSRQSDLDDSVGCWLLEPHPEHPGWTRMSYAIEVRMSPWIPGFVERALARDGLVKSTLWVKQLAEAQAPAAQG